jgi:Ca2+-binding EF-hand superfamily protein
MVPDIMRAAGFYPSASAIQDVHAHIAFLAQARDLDSLQEVDLTTFLMLYINHRPLFDVSAEDLAAAFTALGAPASTGRLAREALLTHLQQAGEKMEAEEMVAIVRALTGKDYVSEAVPHTVDAASFSAEVLGFERAAAHA